MKTSFGKKQIVALVAISSLALLTGCGSSQSAPAPAPGAPGVGGVGGGCVPITTTSMVGFTATGAYMPNPFTSGNTNVQAGIIPQGDQNGGAGTYGTMVVMPGNVTAVQPPVGTGYLGTYSRQRVDGTQISLTATSTVPMQNVQGGYNGGSGGLPYPYNSWPVTGQVNMTGTLQLSAYLQTLLVQTAMGNSPEQGFSNPILNTMPGQYPGGSPYGASMPQICVSNLAFSLQRGAPLDSFANMFTSGQVYIYLSGGVLGTNTGHGLSINF